MSGHGQEYKPKEISIPFTKEYPDFSRFLFTDLQNSIQIVVGDKVFTCSGLVLAQVSEVLEKLVKENDHQIIFPAPKKSSLLS